MRRRRKGFEPCGSFPASQLGVPARRARELSLHRAWSRAAGEEIARQTRELRLRRGVLELVVEDASWSRAVADLLPGLGPRLRAAAPGLKVRKLRLLREGRSAAEVAVDPEAPPVELSTAAPGRAARRGAATVPEVREGLDSRLERIGRRLLERSAQKP